MGRGYILIGEILHALGLGGMRDTAIIGIALSFLLLFLQPALLGFLLDEVIELLLVELFVEFVLGRWRRGKNGRGLEASGWEEGYW